MLSSSTFIILKYIAYTKLLKRYFKILITPVNTHKFVINKQLKKISNLSQKIQLYIRVVAL